MGKVEPMLPDDELDGLLREAVERVRRDPVSDQLIERCASRAMEIPLSSAVRATHTDLDRRATTATSQLWSWREAFALAASLLVVLSVNALSFALDRPDPDRQNTSTSVRGINDLGQVVGASNSAAVTWQNGSIQLLPVQAGLVSVAQGINDAGQIVGGAGDGAPQPMLWQSAGSTPIDLNPAVVAAGYSINSAGQIVGGSFPLAASSSQVGFS